MQMHSYIHVQYVPIILYINVYIHCWFSRVISSHKKSIQYLNHLHYHQQQMHLKYHSECITTQCIAVAKLKWLTTFCWLMSSPAERRSFTMLACPLMLAKWRAENPVNCETCSIMHTDKMHMSDMPEVTKNNLPTLLQNNPHLH